MGKTHTPSAQEVLEVMQRPDCGLVNDAWAARDVAHYLGTTWKKVQPVLEEMERWGWVARVAIKRHRIPRYRIPGG